MEEKCTNYSLAECKQPGRREGAMEKKISPKMIEYVGKLHEAGATTAGIRGIVEVNSTVRLQIQSIHAVLAGGTDNKVFQALETAFEAMWVDSVALAGKEKDMNAVLWP